MTLATIIVLLVVKVSMLKINFVRNAQFLLIAKLVKMPQPVILAIPEIF